MFCQKLIATQNYLLVCVMHSVFDYLLIRAFFKNSSVGGGHLQKGPYYTEVYGD